MIDDERPAIRRRLKPQRRRDQIIASAKVAWSRAGAQRTTMRDIADQAGVTEHFLYQHFESKDEIFQLAVLGPLDVALDQLVDRLRAIAPRETGVLRKLHEVFLSELPAMIPLMSAAQFDDPVKGPLFFRGTMIPAIRSALMKPMTQLTGLSSRSSDLDIAIRAVMGSHFAVALESVLGQETIEVPRVVRDLSVLQPCPKIDVARLPTAKRSTTASMPQIVGASPRGARRRLLSRAERVGLILEAARAEFLRKGLRGTRSRDLAAASGISEAFLFRLFESKEHLYDAAVLRPLASATAVFAARVEDLASSARRAEFLPRFTRLAMSFFAAYGNLFVGALFAELGEGRRYFQEALMPHLHSIDLVLSRIVPGVAPSTVRRAISGACWAITFAPGGGVRTRTSTGRAPCWIRSWGGSQWVNQSTGDACEFRSLGIVVRSRLSCALRIGPRRLRGFLAGAITVARCIASRCPVSGQDERRAARRGSHVVRSGTDDPLGGADLRADEADT